MPTKSNQQLTYQELQSELQSALQRLEAPDIDIDEAVTCYERGLDIIKTLESQILEAENRITKLRASRSKEDA